MPSSFHVEADRNAPDLAPRGQVWLCGHCGQTWRDRRHATCAPVVLVYEVSLRYEDGVLISGESVNDPTAEIPW